MVKPRLRYRRWSIWYKHDCLSNVATPKNIYIVSLVERLEEPVATSAELGCHTPQCSITYSYK